MALLTINLSPYETRRWSSDVQLRRDLRLLADKRARQHGRRFWQITAESGRLLEVGEAQDCRPAEK